MIEIFKTHPWRNEMIASETLSFSEPFTTT
jgi:hypothetical protein